MRLRTGSGSITVDGDPQYDWTARTGSGGIDLHLPANASFDLDAETGSGGIDTARAVRVLGSTSRRRLQATVGAGGARVALSTSSGHIRIE
jgi:DUF4097 and DUF4098 domain-containing protein YvlB